MNKIFVLIYVCISLSTYAQAQDFAIRQWEKSPGRREFVDISHGNRQVCCFVVYWEIAGKATAGM